jgi:hypothetical protein
MFLSCLKTSKLHSKLLSADVGGTTGQDLHTSFLSEAVYCKKPQKGIRFAEEEEEEEKKKKRKFVFVRDLISCKSPLISYSYVNVNLSLCCN